MKRGEVWWVDFGPSQGGEIQKTRPAVIISNDAANRFLNRIQVVPLTSQIDKLYPSEAYVKVSGKQSKAMADQIATVAKHRLKNQAGKLSLKDLQSVERVVKLQLGLGG
jgi:mRNA interferase MazF